MEGLEKEIWELNRQIINIKTQFHRFSDNLNKLSNTGNMEQIVEMTETRGWLIKALDEHFHYLQRLQSQIK